MAMRPDVTPLPPFDPHGDPTSLSQRWKTWKKRFETYLLALNITDDKQKRALLLYQAGQETQEIFDTLTATGDDYKTALDKLTEYFQPKKNVDFETFQFRQATQKSEETVDQFVTRLRKLAEHCEFTELNKELKLAVIQNCASKRLRRYALREDDMTLDKILSKARALESSEEQAKGMEDVAPKEVVQQICRPQNHPRQHQGRPRQTPSNICRQCGLSWPHSKNPCPAKGKTCNKCGKPNHFAKMCLTRQQTPSAQGHSKPSRRNPNRKQINVVVTPPPTKDVSSSDDEDVYTLGHVPATEQHRIPTTTVEINGVKMNLMIDTGASTDIIDEAALQVLNRSKPTQLDKDTCRIFAYGSQSRLTSLGKFEAIIGGNGKQTKSTVHVLKGEHGSLLSFATASKLGLVDVKVNAVVTDPSLIDQYPSVFQGIGNL